MPTNGETIISDIACSRLTMDNNGNLYVSDWKKNENNRVMKWMKDAEEGIIVAGGQGKGNSLKQLSCSSGVFVDQWENVYVVDHLNDRAQKFLID